MYHCGFYAFMAKCKNANKILTIIIGLRIDNWKKGELNLET